MINRIAITDVERRGHQVQKGLVLCLTSLGRSVAETSLHLPFWLLPRIFPPPLSCLTQGFKREGASQHQCLFQCHMSLVAAIMDGSGLEHNKARALTPLPVSPQCNKSNFGSYPLEKEIATHSSTLAWKIPWTEEPDRLQSMGSQRVGHD